MNAAFRTTAADLGNALCGRAPQTVHIVRKSATRSGLRFVVLVDNEYYQVGSAALSALQCGFTPEDLELEPHVDEPDEDDEDAAYRANLRHERDVTPRRL